MTGLDMSLKGLETKYQNFIYSKTCFKRPPKQRLKKGFKDQLSLNADQKYCRMLQESILQYFRPALSYHLSLRHLFCLFLSGHLRQVLLYVLGTFTYLTCFSISKHVKLICIIRLKFA